VASKAVDGRKDTLAATLDRDVHPWWAVDLGAPYDIASVYAANDDQPQWGNYRQTYFINHTQTNRGLNMITGI